MTCIEWVIRAWEDGHGSQEKHVPFNAPESFSVYDPSKNSCKEKLSEAIIEAAEQIGAQRYSKAIHTPRLIQDIDPDIVSKKCPLFRKFYTYLSEFCRNDRAKRK